MSHLSHRLSALVDNELTDAERDRVLAHLARCEQCRAEAAALREVKRRVRELGDVPTSATLTRRLMTIAEPGGPVPQRPRARWGAGAPRPAFRTFGDASRPAGRSRRGHLGVPGADGRSSGGAPRRRRDRARRHRARYVVAGVVSCAVTGLAVSAFTLGGGPATPGPQITPPVRMYSVEHAVVTGEVPFVGSSAVPAPQLSTASRQP